MKSVPNAMKFGNQSRSSSLIFKYNIWNRRSWPEIKNLGRFGLKIAMWSIFMKFRTQNKSNRLIIDILIGIDNLDPKLQICEILSQNWNVLQFSWNLVLKQMEHASYKYSTWNWWSWLKIIDLGKFGPKIEMCSNFHEILRSGHFQISFNKVMNLIKELRNVKTLKSFFSRGVLCTQLNI